MFPTPRLLATFRPHFVVCGPALLGLVDGPIALVDDRIHLVNNSSTVFSPVLSFRPLAARTIRLPSIPWPAEVKLLSSVMPPPPNNRAPNNTQRRIPELPS